MEKIIGVESNIWDGVLVRALLVCKQQKTGLSKEGKVLVHFLEQPGFRYGWTLELILGP